MKEAGPAARFFLFSFLFRLLVDVYLAKVKFFLRKIDIDKQPSN